MKIPQEAIDVIFEEMLEYFSDMSCDEFEIENNEENREFVKVIYGDYEFPESGELFVSAYSVLKYWKSTFNQNNNEFKGLEMLINESYRDE